MTEISQQHWATGFSPTGGSVRFSSEETDAPRGRHAFHGKHAMGVGLTHQEEEARRERLLSWQTSAARGEKNRTDESGQSASGRGWAPPLPPLKLDEEITMNPKTPLPILWRIARERRDLRRWLIVNPSAPPELLEYIAQQGGPGVGQGLRVLFNALDLLGEHERAHTMLPAVLESTKTDMSGRVPVDTLPERSAGTSRRYSHARLAMEKTVSPTPLPTNMPALQADFPPFS